MPTVADLRKIALGFPETEEAPHFEKASFRVKKKIFATWNEKEGLLCVKFSETDQDAFCTRDRSVIYPVPNKWGKQGWTLIRLGQVHPEQLLDALQTAYRTVAPPKLALLL